MIDWDSINYDVATAQAEFEALEVTAHDVGPINLDNEFLDLREKLIVGRDAVYDKHDFDLADVLGYDFDLAFGLELYKCLSNDLSFTNRAASNNDVWRFLSIRVIPDIVHSRFNLKADHFFKQSRRIWLKTLYWYIHLSWNHSEEDTFSILKDNSTDTIANLVERPGLGYNVSLYREIMLQYGENGHDRDLFRRVMKLNTARVVIYAPEFYAGGIKAYVSDLFEIARG